MTSDTMMRGEVGTPIDVITTETPTDNVITPIDMIRTETSTDNVIRTETSTDNVIRTEIKRIDLTTEGVCPN